MLKFERKNITHTDIIKIGKLVKKHGQYIENTIELNNFILSYNEFCGLNKKPILKSDKEERDWLYEKIDFAIKKIKGNKYTRQAIIYNLYSSDLDYNCLNSFHFYYRKNMLNLNIYARSINYDDNFEQDLYTFNMLLNKVCNELMLDKGQIVLFIMSLHKFL